MKVWTMAGMDIDKAALRVKATILEELQYLLANLNKRQKETVMVYYNDDEDE